LRCAAPFRSAGNISESRTTLRHFAINIFWRFDLPL